MDTWLGREDVRWVGIEGGVMEIRNPKIEIPRESEIRIMKSKSAYVGV